jgi:carboxymethylenebutenolidase
MDAVEETVRHTGVPLHVTRPAHAPGAALVLLHEAFGVTEHIRDVARRFAAEGYLVVTPHLFHRLSTQQFSYDDIAAAKGAIAEVGIEDVLADTEAARSWLETSDGAPGAPVATIGFCFGGKVGFLAATSLQGLAASVCFYGAGIAPEQDPAAPVNLASQIACPVLAIYGESDPMIPPAEVDRVRRALEAAGVLHVVKVFKAAGHGFFCDARPKSYNAAAAADAWELTLTFLAAAAGLVAPKEE